MYSSRIRKVTSKRLTVTSKRRHEHWAETIVQNRKKREEKYQINTDKTREEETASEVLVEAETL